MSYYDLKYFGLGNEYLDRKAIFSNLNVSTNHFIKMQILVQLVWDEALESAFLNIFPRY